VKANDVEIGSITGGGRYDNLTGVFGQPGLSGVGISFGADRIYDVLNQLNLYPEEITSSVRVLFVNFGEKEAAQARKYVSRLRKAGVSCQLYPESAKMKKQMSMANAEKIPYVAIIGEDELANDTITLKDMNTGEQSRVTIETYREGRMKELITEQQFLVRQPSFPEKTPTTDYYLRLANLMVNACRTRRLLAGWPDSVITRTVLGLVGYFQDILTDSGIWRSFIECHKSMYGRWVPFYETGEDYIPHELNREDIRFLVWYTLCMNYEDRRLLNPMSEDVAEAADLWFEMLDKIYEEAPTPEGFFIWQGLELNNPEEHREVVGFSHWLFMHCYLLTPAFAETLGEILSRPGIKDSENMVALQNALEEAMAEVPTGPLALYLGEWLYMILTGKMPDEVRDGESAAGEEHPTYTKFVKATGGSPIKFIEGYEALNKFCIEALGWEPGVDHLPAMKQCKDFILLVNREKGMLLAHDICKCVCMPENPYYDKEYARTHAIYLLTVRGACPADLLHYLWAHDALPDTRFPGSNDHELVERNRDFIARCYLQQYYRGD
ncbi:MAG: DUF3843 family protein, partial [Muribaculaceae bacterium]|nr:DUF3843 family protein [Muribaculaceae bacterium]